MPLSRDVTIGTDKVEKDYIYTVENRLKAVYDGDDLLVAMAYDGDGNRIFQLNYNLHTDDDWKGNNGNGNGNNKNNTGNGKMDTAYSYGNERLTVERFDGWTGYYTYDPRGSVSGVTGSDGYLWQSYRYDVFGGITFGGPQYNNVYAYNAESYNPNLDNIYLRARYYYTATAAFMSEDGYLGDISDPLRNFYP